jgi:hypothetical protein
MSLSHSPSVVTNGLVLYYDMNNTQKSWKGAPATNLFTYSSEFDNAAWFKGLSSVTANTTIAPDGTLTADTLSFSAAANANLQPTTAPTVTIGQQYTYSVYVRASSAVSNVNISMTGSDVAIAVTTEWQRVSRTVTASGSTLGPTLVTRNAVATDIYIWGAQLEAGSYATPYIPTTTTSASRSNTQAIVDLTNNNTVTASSLTYAANNTFSFNGTSDSITVPFNATSFTFNNEQTIIIWMKNQSPSTARRNPYNQAYGGGGTITHENDTYFNYFYGTAGTNGTPYTAHGSPFSVVVGETAMICITRNVTQTAWYKNGVLGNTQSNPYGATVVTGTANITIGNGYSVYFGGSIYAVQLYNRALSAAEVSQNFNALRGRYEL